MKMTEEKRKQVEETSETIRSNILKRIEFLGVSKKQVSLAAGRDENPGWLSNIISTLGKSHRKLSFHMITEIESSLGLPSGSLVVDGADMEVEAPPWVSKVKKYDESLPICDSCGKHKRSHLAGRNICYNCYSKERGYRKSKGGVS